MVELNFQTHHIAFVKAMIVVEMRMTEMTSPLERLISIEARVKIV